jgi:hypothetical protein
MDETWPDAGAPRAKESSQSRGTAAPAAVYAISGVFVGAAMDESSRNLFYE